MRYNEMCQEKNVKFMCDIRASISFLDDTSITSLFENLLSNAPLTFHELTEIERSFLRTFSGIMHDRIEYPEEKKP